MLIPSIDLLGGKVVQLKGGDPELCKVALDDPMAVAEQWARYGELAVIDLDAALGSGDNTEIIGRICAKYDARVGGGIRDHDRADLWLRLGAKKLIIGTRATPEFLSRYPRERLIVAVDSKGGKVVTRGWTESTNDTPIGRALALQEHCSEFLYTLVDREGAMGGTDLQAVQALVDATDNHVTAAGGITTIDEVVALEQMGASSQLGMAIYTGAMSLTDAFTTLLDWRKNDGLIPVVTQDRHGQVVMQAWADRAAVAESLDTGWATYFSRSRQQRWQKGETSGHRQQLLGARYDCDRDTVLYIVDQAGQACHVPGKYSCFGDQRFGLSRLQDVLQDRLRDADEGSYTARLFADPALLQSKIAEECEELLQAKTDREVIWETADVVYFAMVNLVSRGLSLEQVEKELFGRHGRRRG